MLLAPLFLAAALAPASGGDTVALLPIVASGLAVDEVGVLDRTIGAAVADHFGARLLDAAATRARLTEGGAMGVRCDRTDPTCSAQLGAVCGVDVVVTASFSVTANKSTLAFHLVDVAEATQAAHVVGKVAADPTPQEIAALLAALDTPAARATRVHVVGTRGQPVFIDGVARGALPLPVIDDLAPGRHEVAVGDGARRYVVTIEARRGEPVAVAAPVAAAPRPAPVATPVAPAPTAPPTLLGASPVVVVAAGGVTALAGAVALGIGLLPFAAATESAQRLGALEAEARENPDSVGAQGDVIRAERAIFDENNAAWNSWGSVAAIAGGTALAVGLVATGVGAVFLLE